jgi:AraC-like DNA-binding protein
MRQPALTRASTIGPIVDVVKQGGGSITRVFRASDLPLQIRDQPDLLIPLSNQFKLVECAARELGDAALPARLAMLAGTAGLGPYGEQFAAAPGLRAAIQHGNEIFASTLQSATQMALTVEGRLARWKYWVEEPVLVGRQKNAILAIGYMIDLLRRFTGTRSVPTWAELPGASPHGRREIEMLFQCEMRRGEAAAVFFPADLLDVPNSAPGFCNAPELPGALPVSGDLPGHVRELIRLAMLDKRPGREWVARHLSVSVRTLQRCLKEHGTSFAAAVRSALQQQATVLLRSRNLSVSEVAYELGYSDPAHFTRAFKCWLGESPRDWRRRNRAAAGC